MEWPKILQCLHCDTRWPQKSKNKIPVRCPKCNNPWNVEPIGKGNWKRI